MAAENHFHLDHLGSTRPVSDHFGKEASRYTYYPFGEMAVPGATTSEPFALTGHERDFNCEGCDPPGNDDLDYTLARYCSPVMGRFLSLDPERVAEPVREPSTGLTRGGTFNVNIFALKRIGSGGNLRGLLGAFEREAGRLGAARLAIRGTLAKGLFPSARAQAILQQLGYTFNKLEDGTILLIKAIPK